MFITVARNIISVAVYAVVVFSAYADMAVSKRRLGSLTRDDVVVVDVTGGGGGSIDTNTVTGIVTNYDSAVIQVRESNIVERLDNVQTFGSNHWLTTCSYIDYFEKYCTNNYTSAWIANARATSIERWMSSVSNDLLLASASVSSPSNSLKLSQYFSNKNNQLVNTVNRVVTQEVCAAESRIMGMGYALTNDVLSVLNAQFTGGTSGVNSVVMSFIAATNSIRTIEQQTNCWITIGDVIDNLTSVKHFMPLSANMGKALNDRIIGLYTPGDWISVTNGSTKTATTNYVNDAIAGIVMPTGDRITETNGLSTIYADGTWLTRTNATDGVVETNALCTVAAASAMTNALPNWTKSADKPTYTASEVGALPNNAVIERISKGIYTVNGDLNVSTNVYDTWTPSSPMPDYVIRWWWADDTYIPGDYDLRADTTLYGEVSAGRYEPELGNPNKRNKVAGPEGAPDYFTCSISRVPYSRLALTNDIPDVSSFVTGETATNIAEAVTNGLESAAHATATYQPKGDYLTSESDPTAYAKMTNAVESGFLCTVAAASAMTNDATLVRYNPNGFLHGKLMHGNTSVTAEEVEAVSIKGNVEKRGDLSLVSGSLNATNVMSSGSIGYEISRDPWNESLRRFYILDSYGITIKRNPMSAKYTVNYPSTSGTFALTSDIPDAYTKTEADAAFATKASVPTTYLKSATSTDTSITVTTQDDTTVGLEVQYDYALTNLTTGTLSLRSGEIGNYATAADFTLTLDFAANGRSGDCLLYVINSDTAAEHTITLKPNTYTFVSTDIAKARTLGKATTNIVTFTRLKADTVLVSKLEVK